MLYLLSYQGFMKALLLKRPLYINDSWNKWALALSKLKHDLKRIADIIQFEWSENIE